VLDVIKVFATSAIVDFGALTQGSVKGTIDDPLSRLVAQGSRGESRGSKPVAIDLDSWATAQRVFKVKR
jgi:hypothetical protein